MLKRSGIPCFRPPSEGLKRDAHVPIEELAGSLAIKSCCETRLTYNVLSFIGILCPFKDRILSENWIIASQTSSFEEIKQEDCIFLSMFRDLIQGGHIPLSLELDPLSKFSFGQRNLKDDCLEPVCFRWTAAPQTSPIKNWSLMNKEEAIITWRSQE
jgi:hypothetical protein